MIEYVTGDLFQNKDVQAYAHGVNCQGVMGAGIAVEFARRYPVMYDWYKTLCKSGLPLLASCRLYQAERPAIFNLFTQPRPERGAAMYKALRDALKEMRDLADESGITTIAMPRVGCGIGGLRWPITRAIIEDVMAGWSGTLYVHTLKGEK